MEKKITITMLIGVINILIKINWLSLHLLYVYYFMLCILVYKFELHEIIRIKYQHLKVIPCYILRRTKWRRCVRHLGFTSPGVKHTYP